MTREALPNRRHCVTQQLEYVTENGVIEKYHVTIGYYPDGRPGEIFCNDARTGSDRQSELNDASITISVALQEGRDLVTLGDSLGPSRLGWLTRLAAAAPLLTGTR